MKIKLDIDCTPDEVRDFFGLPQVKPLQDELLKEVQERLSVNIKAMDPEAMLKTWLPAPLKGLDHLQEMFLSRLGGAGARRKYRGPFAADSPTSAAFVARRGHRGLRRDVGRGLGSAGMRPLGRARFWVVSRRASRRGQLYRRRRSRGCFLRGRVHPGRRGRLATSTTLLGSRLRDRGG